MDLRSLGLLEIGKLLVAQGEAYTILLPNPLYKYKLSGFDYLQKSGLKWHAIYEMHITRQM